LRATTTPPVTTTCRWVIALSESTVIVTSDRLRQADGANRMFPKVRSWFALGAPLELLSALSVARILVLVAIATWGAGLAVSVWTPFWSLTLVAAWTVGLVLLLRLRMLTSVGTSVVVGAHVVAIGAALGLSNHDLRVVVLAPLLVVLSLCIGLFFRGMPMLVAIGATSIVLVGVTASTNGAKGLADGLMVILFLAGLSTMAAFAARTSRISGAIDPATGIANIRGMTDRLRNRTPDRETVVATIHLSGVTEVRDALGHDAGIELVRRAVEDLGQVLPAQAQIGRGGDDDVVILIENGQRSDVTLETLIATTVRQISSAIGSGRYLVGEIEVTLSTHIGIAIAANAEDDAGEILRQSSLAAASATASGRLHDRWDGRSTNLNAEDLEILSDLRTAQERGELWIAYQPQVEPHAGRIVAVEALLRWSSPRHGFVSPGRFIPLAERTGLVDRLTDWVVNEALDAQVRWRSSGVDLTVSVNVSPLSLRSIDFGDRVRFALEARSLPPGVLMLEVTESAAFDIPEAVERLGPLRELGVKISIDDFGTGYTSLAVLPHLPLDELKVDQQFVMDAIHSSASRSIVISVCDLAHRLGLTAVAEGVEDAELADLMASFGFDLLQGYHFAKPMPEAALLERMSSDAITTATPPSPSEPIHGTVEHSVTAVGTTS